MYTKDIRCAGHLHYALDPARLKEKLPEIIEVLSRYEFDAIAFRGLSGALVAPTVAMMMGKTLLAVRKLHEAAHSIHLVEGDIGATKFVILDDFSSSGKTVYEILKAVKTEFESQGCPVPECVGLYQYLFRGKELIDANDACRFWRSVSEKVPLDDVVLDDALGAIYYDFAKEPRVSRGYLSALPAVYVQKDATPVLIQEDASKSPVND